MSGGLFPPTPRRRRRRQFVIVLGAVIASISFTTWYFLLRDALSASDRPEQTYDRIFAAYGGWDAYERWRVGRVRYEAIEERPGVFTAQINITETFRLPEQLRRVDSGSLLGRQVKIVSVTNGDRQWLKVNESEVQTGAAEPNVGVTSPAFLTLFHPLHVLGNKTAISVRGNEDRADGTRDLVLAWLSPNGEREECHAEVRTGLIREFQGTMVSPVSRQRVWARFEYADYRKTIGGIVPGLITGYQGDQKVLEVRLVSLELDTIPDPRLFEPLLDDTEQ